LQQYPIIVILWWDIPFQSFRSVFNQEERSVYSLAGSNKRIKIKKNRYDRYGYYFVAPFVVFFLVFSLYPIINTFALSFTNAQFMNGLQGDFVGLKNFEELLQDATFWDSVRITWYIWLLNFIPQLGFALLLAALFTNQHLKLHGVGFFKSVFYLPNLLMPATVASLFFSLFQTYGPVNQILARMNLIEQNINWLNSPTVAQNLVIFIQWWLWFGQTTIVVMAGMMSIPATYYEAGMVDGASQTRMFFKITLPLIKPILLYVLVTSLVGGLQIFDIPFFLTNGRGDPNGAIMTMNILMNIKRTSANGDIGAAAAVSVLIFLMSTLVALIIFGILRDKNDNTPCKG
jgi:ABC-type sugar transport system permease subunit